MCYGCDLCVLVLRFGGSIYGVLCVVILTTAHVDMAVFDADFFVDVVSVVHIDILVIDIDDGHVDMILDIVVIFGLCFVGIGRAANVEDENIVVVYRVVRMQGVWTVDHVFVVFFWIEDCVFLLLCHCFFDVVSVDLPAISENVFHSDVKTVVGAVGIGTVGTSVVSVCIKVFFHIYVFITLVVIPVCIDVVFTIILFSLGVGVLFIISGMTGEIYGVVITDIIIYYSAEVMIGDSSIDGFHA